MDRRIIIGSDHGGYALKTGVVKFLKKKGFDVTDIGTNSNESCDYPDYAFSAAEKISTGEFSRGILICTTGIGVSICANKLVGIRAALCTSVEQAELSRKHNDSNVLALAEKFTSLTRANKICNVWLRTEFEGGRHYRRVNKIATRERRT
ncbi:MAG: ribose 5-phosphate isomerase B [Candidatus Omnitrophica bacterium]|nr:ribose 5-phosphate isomerase B [Candidatus Omnitrophota bacterium]